MNINHETKWIQNGITIAGGYGQGNQLNQLYYPKGIFLDEDDQTIYIADSENNRILQWKFGEKYGQVVASGNREESTIDQLKWPSDVIIDKKNNSLIICDSGNQRVVQWSHKNNTFKQIEYKLFSYYNG
jgi:sugar lactone lactonase YvrE